MHLLQAPQNDLGLVDLTNEPKYKKVIKPDPPVVQVPVKHHVKEPLIFDVVGDNDMDAYDCDMQLADYYRHYYGID